MARKFQILRGLKTKLPTLAQGELAMTTDSGREGLYLGTGGKNIRFAPAESVYASVTMLASGWSGNTYSFESSYPSASYDIGIEVAPTATAEQFEAFGGAMICGSSNSNVATALGEVPTVDIPVLVKVVEK